MKVRCIDNANGMIDLTIGKEYEVLNEDGTMCRIVDNTGGALWVLKKRLEFIEEQECKKCDYKKYCSSYNKNQYNHCCKYTNIDNCEKLKEIKENEEVDRNIYNIEDFSWESFKEGKIAVWCENKELREDFLKQCDENEITLSSKMSDSVSNKGEENTAYSAMFGGVGFCHYEWYQENGLKVIKWEIKNKKYEGWEIIKMLSEGKIKNGTKLKDRIGNIYTVYDNCLLDGEHFEFKGYGKETRVSCVIDECFAILEREKFTIDIAYKEYMNGKKIESCVTGDKYIKTDEIHFSFINKEEFEGMWFIEGR